MLNTNNKDDLLQAFIPKQEKKQTSLSFYGFSVNYVEKSKDCALFEMNPLKRGLGDTLGNAIRRTLYHSTLGLAVVHFSGTDIKHKFHHLDYLKEDVLELAMNIQGIVFDAENYLAIKEGEESEHCLKINKSGIITAECFEVDGLKVINKDKVVMTKSGDEEIEINFTVKKGCGFVGIDKITESQYPDNVIPINPWFCPVIRSHYVVQRSEQSTNIEVFDNLSVEILTNGSISPKHAFFQALDNINKHIQYIIDKSGSFNTAV